MAGRYKILEHLGVGGVGEVFKAFDTQLDRYVAIKRLLSREESETGDSIASTLKKEAASLATLQHPNIVSVYDLSSDDVGMFIVMELLEGDTLNDWLQNGTMELGDFKEFATQTLEGILSAHQVNILHRDLKPENIKMNRLPGGRLQAKIVDFGLARMSYAARKQTEDQSGNVLGSIFYMAPEQFLRKALDGRSDLYSLGCVYYQCLSGRRPFDGATVHSVMDAHLQHLVYDLKELCPQIPAPICEWVMWLINADQGHRPANARAALDHLRALVEAGWFAIAEATTPVAAPAPVVTAAPARTTGQTPGRSPSGLVKPPTSSQPLARPLGASTSALRGSQPQPAKAAAAVAVEQAAQPQKGKIPVWAITAAVVGLAVVGWIAFGHKSSQPSSTIAAVGSVAHPEMPRQKDMLLHFLATPENLVGTTAKMQADSQVLKWNDLQKKVDTFFFKAANNSAANAPILKIEKLEKMKMAIPFLRFELDQSIGVTIDENKPQAKQFPFGADTKEKGLTAIIVLRTDGNGDFPTTPLRMGLGNTRSYLRYNPKDKEFFFSMTVGEKRTYVKLKGFKSVKGFAIISIVMNGKTGKLLICGRSSDSGRDRSETDFPEKDLAKISSFRYYNLGSELSMKQHPEDQFKGDIAEFQLYNFPMSTEDRTLTEQTLAEYYFTSPGGRYN